ncbi:MAG: helix-turn-helix transcriptional regulator [Alphaproteobacteria bacterium]|nr:helix-turn-helix transcriptional regulator [Alphaproteobacteria bacterium]
MDLDLIAKRLEALGSPTRLEVFRILVRGGPDGLPVAEVRRRAGVPGSTLSHHLHRLIGVGLVTQERQGTTLICRADFAAMNETLGFLMAECCADACK